MRARLRLLLPVLVTGVLLSLTVGTSAQAAGHGEASDSRLAAAVIVVQAPEDPDDPGDDWPWDCASCDAAAPVS
ncbi:hypothetical protein RB614_11555 [Phytohabitans sp. ZYX-F-186]|uniref:Secreted protein n=1 Tax=Phytohabitans maris TaxID=3071409 RepID=A0ABU0ZDP6_9ACTN|nr:hypothetical protein [Phytohabitans sp. ZYX-F-186]MDQ7905158.1 hypothetical protein [Phytohabitans sp. ZYX-F-186]